MKYKKFASKIIALYHEDIALRDQLIACGKLSDGYHIEMQAMHERNAEKLISIIDEIGYPTGDKVGEEASEASWMIIQHAIGRPVFMKKCLTLLKESVTNKTGNPLHLAYLADRIAVFEGNHQHYGTQFDWDLHGELSPTNIDNMQHVNERRKLIGLNSLEEQTKIVRARAKEENQHKPDDFDKRKQEIIEWKKMVGWII